MQIEIINGQFSKTESIELISQMISTKIKFLENKICNSHNEEDIKNKESKIISLQNKLVSMKEKINSSSNDINLHGIIEIDS